MPDHLVVSYSAVDGRDFALKLADELASGPPPISVWVDKRDLRPGEDWDEQIVEAIRTCKGMLFIMTSDSIRPDSVCKDEWVRALRYKKPVIPLRLCSEAELPFRLGSREYVDFSEGFAAAMARLRKHLAWMDSPPGQLQALNYRLADAQRELPRAEPERQTRIQADIDELKLEIAQRRAVIANPQAAAQRVDQSIAVGLERARQPAAPVSGISLRKFVNPPPVVAPAWFQDRHVETRLVGDFLKDDALRVMTIVGRGGIGKSAMACRLLRSLETGQLPDDGGPLAIDGIVYLSDAREFHRVTIPDLYAGLTRLLPEETVRRIDALYKNPQATTKQTIEALAEAFPEGRTVVLLDNFEDALTVDTGQIKDPELDSALRTLLKAPPHGLKVIITTRIAPRELALAEPALFRRLDLDAGLGLADAAAMLQAMDVDGKAGLRHGDDALIAQAWERTRGYPRALEHLFGILSADRDTTLKDLLEDTGRLLPDRVVEVLVGEAFSRLDATAQLVMEALATYRYPVMPEAVDYLLQPYVTGLASGHVLSRLVNMQFVRRDAGRYYLHQVDRDYALSRIAQGTPGDGNAELPGFTQFALRYRAAEWFKLSRKPREAWKSLQDLTAQLSEFDLRCEAEDYNSAAAIFLEFDFDYLFLWGHYQLMTDLHERLQGRIADPALAIGSGGNLGGAYLRMGQHQRAIDCYEKALRLAQNNSNRWGEVASLGNLGACIAELGQNGRAIDYFEQALAIRRELGDKAGESNDLGNLGNRYTEIGELRRALDYHQQALAIDREIGNKASEALHLANIGQTYDYLGQNTEATKLFEESLAITRDIGYRLIEAVAQAFLGDFYLVTGKGEKAAQLFEQSIETADEIGNLQVQKHSRTSAARSSLCRDDLATARLMAEAADRLRFPLDDTVTSAILGITACRQADSKAAIGAFTAAIDHADELLGITPNLHAALDAKALSLCGLALCGDPGQLPAARTAFTAARQASSAAGLVGRVLQLFDALAQADNGQILADLRPTAAGPASAGRPADK